MSQETINIEIAGRSYPLTVSLEEVDGIISAVEEIDAMIANLKSQFAVQDRNDLLAMTALQLSLKIKEIESSGGAQTKAQSGSSSENKEEDIKLAASVEDLLQRLNSAMEEVVCKATTHGPYYYLFSYLSYRRTCGRCAWIQVCHTVTS